MRVWSSLVEYGRVESRQVDTLVGLFLFLFLFLFLLMLLIISVALV